jgi:hypothetical protein
MEEFQIKDNLIVTKNQITLIFKIDPIDLIILPVQEQKSFEMDMKRMLNIIGENSIQIIMRTRKATKNDLGKHFHSFNQTNNFSNLITENITKKLLTQYVAQLVDLLEKNIIPVKEYYLVLKQPLSKNNPEQMLKAVNNLERTASKIYNNFKRAGIDLEHVKEENNNLINLIQSYTRLK